ncbi:unnamed protein product [Polarella glacialis]|uniref:RING-type E3 ubiquitin transferase n=1 Tax=Polarella glacialis TaxID=89957 RepID=A0A813JYN4_POLGL|nr:unnamed protein product [Polarella glacialis]
MMSKISADSANDDVAAAFTDADVASAANAGSFQKALVLLKQGAVRISGRRADGCVEAQVQSERSGASSYSVLLAASFRTVHGPRAASGCKVAAKCTCFDYTRRGGLCKHGAAAALLFRRQDAGDLEALPLKLPEAREAKRSAPKPDGAGRKRLFPAADDSAKGDDQCRTPTRQGSDDASSKESHESPARPMKQPCFPVAAAVSTGPAVSKKGSAVKAALMLRLLQNAACAGDHQRFKAELKRYGEAALSVLDASGLLHQAILGQDVCGATLIVKALLELPEGAAAAVSARDATKRSPLHAAVSASRIEICQVLLAAKADPLAKAPASLGLLGSQYCNLGVSRVPPALPLSFRQTASDATEVAAATEAAAASPPAVTANLPAWATASFSASDEPSSPRDENRTEGRSVSRGVPAAPEEVVPMQVADGSRRALACAHYLCRNCSSRVGGRCPLCRKQFAGVQELPDLKRDPIAWFEFAAGCTEEGTAAARPALPVGLPYTPSQASAVSTPAARLLRMRSWPRPSRGSMFSAPFRRCVTGSFDHEASRDLGAACGQPGLEMSTGGPREGYISRRDIEHILPATLPVDPQLLSQALDEGLWAEWDADEDGVISRQDFFDPRHGLLRWLLVHLVELRAESSAGAAPDVETDRAGWFRHLLLSKRGLGPFFQRPCASSAGLRRGDALRALLRLAGASSLERRRLEEFRSTVEQFWEKWDPSGSGLVPSHQLLQPAGPAQDLLWASASARLRCSLQRLADAGSSASSGAQGAGPGAYVIEISKLCRLLASLGRDGAGAERRKTGAEGRGFSSCAPASPRSLLQAVKGVHVARKNLGEDVDRLLYGESLSFALLALERFPSHIQVVRWACRLITFLLLGLSESTAALTPESSNWAQLLQVGLDSSAALLLASGKEIPRDLQAMAFQVVKSTMALCGSPCAAADPSFGSTVMSASLLLWLLSRGEAESCVLSLLTGLQTKPESPQVSSAACHSPAGRAVVSALTCLLLGDPAGLVLQMEAWGHSAPPPPLWTPLSTMAVTSITVGEPVEVCCQGGWLEGTVLRAPVSEPSQPRDECWMVACKGSSSSQGDSARIYSRHVWSPGWRLEAAAAFDRMRCTIFAHVAACEKLQSSGASLLQRWPTDAVHLRRELLASIVVQGLAPKALAVAPSPSGPVLRGAVGIPLHCGDKVWLSVSVERAKQLQTARHGDWSDHMGFCLDCPGRLVETLAAPPRVRVSHGSLGTFLWNPAAVTRAESSAEALPFEEQHGPLMVGDEVLLGSDQERAVPLQVGHGGWSARMAHALGRFGRLAGLNNRGDLRVDTPGCGVFLWNPASVGSSAFVTGFTSLQLLSAWVSGASPHCPEKLKELSSPNCGDDDPECPLEGPFHTVNQSVDDSFRYIKTSYCPPYDWSCLSNQKGRRPCARRQTFKIPLRPTIARSAVPLGLGWPAGKSSQEKDLTKLPSVAMNQGQPMLGAIGVLVNGVALNGVATKLSEALPSTTKLEGADCWVDAAPPCGERPLGHERLIGLELEELGLPSGSAPSSSSGAPGADGAAGFHSSLHHMGATEADEALETETKDWSVAVAAATDEKSDAFTFLERELQSIGTDDDPCDPVFLSAFLGAALVHCADRGFLECVQFLMSRGAPLDGAGARMLQSLKLQGPARTPLELAARRGHVAICRLLLESGAVCAPTARKAAKELSEFGEYFAKERSELLALLDKY